LKVWQPIMHQISIILISLLNIIYVSRKIINELQVFDDPLEAFSVTPAISNQAIGF